MTIPTQPDAHPENSAQATDTTPADAALPLTNKRLDAQKNAESYREFVPAPNVPVVIDDIKTISRKGGKSSNKPVPR